MFLLSNNIRPHPKSYGFTLIELIIVIIVFSILLSIAIPSYKYYVGLARASRLQSYANAMMSGARIANAISVTAGASASDLLKPNDGNAVYNWPTKAYMCNLLTQQMSSAADAPLTSTSVPISCSNGLLQDTTSTNPSLCFAEYYESTGPSVSGYVDFTHITAANCQ